MITETTALRGTPIDYNTLRAGLQKLNPDLYFDDDAHAAIYYGVAEGGPRVGIWHWEKHICNVERTGAIPEYTMYTDYRPVVMTVPLQEVLSDPSKKSILKEVAVKRGHPEFRNIDQYLGVQLATTEKRGDVEIAIYREGPDTIVIATPCAAKMLPHTVVRIGWTDIFHRLLHARIPGITYASLSKTFNVDFTLNHPPHDIELQEAMKAAGVV